jgi:hypothetical protein
LIGGYLYKSSNNKIVSSLITGFKYDATKNPHRVTFNLSGRFCSVAKNVNHWKVESTESHSISFVVKDVTEENPDWKKFYGSFKHLEYGVYYVTLEGGWVPCVTN